MGGVADPRVGHKADDIGGHMHGMPTAHDAPLPATSQARRHSAIYLDSSISFEDYHYWANQSRAIERNIEVSNEGMHGWWKLMFGHRSASGQTLQSASSEAQAGEKSTVAVPDSAGGGNLDNDKDTRNPSLAKPSAPAEDRYGISLAEWDTAQRALRTASWGSVFYLITTDILGPFSVPFAMSRMGYGIGFALYTTFAAMAAYSGLRLWQQFMGLDSTRFPLRNYGDLAFRIYGKWARTGVNVLQSFNFFFTTAQVMEGVAQGLAQMARGPSGTGYLCFVVAEVIVTVCGAVLGQIRTLRSLSWLANLSVWLNVVCIIMTMVVTAYYPPNYPAIEAAYNIPPNQPVSTSVNWPEDISLNERLNGLSSLIFAFGGATLFNELMAEMRRPMDFWKGFILAEIFIYIVYMVMGMVVYTNQGQYVYSLAYQAYGWQTTGNAINFVTGLISTLLYSNIGIKVFYAAVLRDVFHFLPLDDKVGKRIWILLVPIYWSLAFIVAAAVPQITNLTSFVGAACVMQFSYTLPPILKVGFNCQKDAMLPEESYDPATGHVERVDSGFTRWWRGFQKQWMWNTIDIVYFFAALTTAILGIYGAIVSMHDAFKSTPLTSFTCKAPV